MIEITADVRKVVAEAGVEGVVVVYVPHTQPQVLLSTKTVTLMWFGIFLRA